MAALDLPIGARVLIGTPGITDPADWWFATVLWTDGCEVLVQQGGIAGATPHTAIHMVDLVRAVGDLTFLAIFKAQASEAVGESRLAVRDAELALGKARDAVWAHVRAIGADRPCVEAPPERAARRRTRARKRLGLETA